MDLQAPIECPIDREIRVVPAIARLTRLMIRQVSGTLAVLKVRRNASSKPVVEATECRIRKRVELTLTMMPKTIHLILIDLNQGISASNEADKDSFASRSDSGRGLSSSASPNNRVAFRMDSRTSADAESPPPIHSAY